MAVVLHGRQEAHVLKSRHAKRGSQQPGRLGKGLQAHHARQNRNAVDGMIVEERLHLGVEPDLGRHALVQIEADVVEGQRQRLFSSPRQQAAVGIDAAILVKGLHQDAQLVPHHGLAGKARLQRMADHRQSLGRRQHVDPRALHDLGNASARGHADTAPGGPVERDAERPGTRRRPPGKRLTHEVVA